MKRRNFLNTIFAAATGMGISSKEITEPVKIIQIADTHLWNDDERGEPYQQYSARMARAYNQTRHFRTGELTDPEEAFQEVLKMAVEKEADLFAVTSRTGVLIIS